jgi:hypothetical protein
MFDDACCGFKSFSGGHLIFGTPNGPARGLVLKLDLTKHTGSFVSQYVRAKNFVAGFLGSTQLLPGGNVAISWGSNPFFSEVDSRNNVLLDAVWPPPDFSYRTFVQGWTGIPFFPPSGAVRDNRGKNTVYASWDGDTQVVSWRVLAGSSANSLKAVASKTKTGFETTIPLTSSFKVYKVEALDAHRHVLGTSNAFPQPTTSSPNSGLPGQY